MTIIINIKIDNTKKREGKMKRLLVALSAIALLASLLLAPPT
jgi:hypothetical protein